MARVTTRVKLKTLFSTSIVLWPDATPLQGDAMIEQQMRCAVRAVRTPAQRDEVSRAIWAAFGNGKLSDETAQALIDEMAAPRQRAVVWRRPSIFPERSRQLSPDRAVSIGRRRRLAATGPLPPALACAFTTGQLAVLRVVADEVQQHGACTLTLAAVAARAGVCRSLVQISLRLAAADGLLIVQERRQRGQKNLPNIVRIVSLEWSVWLRRGPKNARPGVPGLAAAPGCKNTSPTKNNKKYIAFSLPADRPWLPERQAMGARWNRSA